MGWFRAWGVGMGSQDPLGHTPSVSRRWGPHTPFSRMSSAPSSHWSSSSYSSSTSETGTPGGQGGIQGKDDRMTTAPRKHLWATGTTNPHLTGQDTEARTGEALTQSLRTASSSRVRSNVQIRLTLKVIPPPTTHRSILKIR